MNIIRQHHILYIEDHADTRELVTLALARNNYTVTTTSNIEDGLRLALEKSFDLYILDSWLPDGSGIELCKKLRGFDQITPIMFFSAAAYDVDRQTAIKSGAQVYLIKPADPDVLCSEVRRLIDVSLRTRNSLGSLRSDALRRPAQKAERPLLPSTERT